VGKCAPTPPLKETIPTDFVWKNTSNPKLDYIGGRGTLLFLDTPRFGINDKPPLVINRNPTVMVVTRAEFEE